VIIVNYKFVTVGYIPNDEDADLTTGKTLLFDGPLAAGFEKLIAGAAVVNSAVPYKYGQTSADHWDTIVSESKCRAQLITQSGVKDPHAAEFLARFYGYIESKLWEKLENCLDDNLAWEWDFRSLPAQSSRSLFIETVRAWRNRSDTVGFNIHWANVSSERAIVEFNCVDEQDAHMTQYEYERRPTGYVITAIYNHSINRAPLFSPEPPPSHRAAQVKLLGFV
jgi:hypothetical protein